jgi:hypothetical protein
MSAGIWHQATSRHMTVTITVNGKTERRSFLEITRNQPWSFNADAAEAVSSALVELVTRINGDGTTTDDPDGVTATVDMTSGNTVTFTVNAEGAARGDWYQLTVQITGTSGAVWTELLDLKVVN